MRIKKKKLELNSYKILNFELENKDLYDYNLQPLQSCILCNVGWDSVTNQCIS